MLRAQVVRSFGSESASRPPNSDEGSRATSASEMDAREQKHRPCRRMKLSGTFISVGEESLTVDKITLPGGGIQRCRRFDEGVEFFHAGLTTRHANVNGSKQHRKSRKFVLCVLRNGKVEIWDENSPHHTLMDMQLDMNRDGAHGVSNGGLAGSGAGRSQSGVRQRLFSLAASNKPGTYVLASVGVLSPFGLDVLEIDLCTLSWNTLTLTDFGPEGFAKVRCLAAAPSALFGLVAIAHAGQGVALYSHRGCVTGLEDGTGTLGGDLSSSTSVALLWRGTHLAGLAASDGNLVQWSLVPEKKTKRNSLGGANGENRRRDSSSGKLELFERARLSLSKGKRCSSISLVSDGLDGDLAAVACAVFDGCVAILDMENDNVMRVVFPPSFPLPRSCQVGWFSPGSAAGNLGLGLLVDQTTLCIAKVHDNVDENFSSLSCAITVWPRDGLCPMPPPLFELLGSEKLDDLADCKLDCLPEGETMLVYHKSLHIAELWKWDPSASSTVSDASFSPYEKVLLEFLPRDIQDAILLAPDLVAVLSNDRLTYKFYDICVKALVRSDALPSAAATIFRDPAHATKVLFVPANEVCESQGLYSSRKTDTDTFVNQNGGAVFPAPPAPYYGSFFSLDAQKGTITLLQNRPARTGVERQRPSKKRLIILAGSATVGAGEIGSSLKSKPRADSFALLGVFEDCLIYRVNSKVIARPIPSVALRYHQTNTNSASSDLYHPMKHMPSQILFNQHAVYPDLSQRKDLCSFRDPGSLLMQATFSDRPTFEKGRLSQWFSFRSDYISDTSSSRLREGLARDDEIGFEDIDMNISRGLLPSEECVVGYWRFESIEKERDLTADNVVVGLLHDLSHTGSQATLGAESTIVDSVVDSCTELDPGDPEFTPPPRAVAGSLLLNIFSLVQGENWTLEFWFRLRKSVTSLLRAPHFELVMIPNVVGQSSYSINLGHWHHIALVKRNEERFPFIVLDGVIGEPSKLNIRFTSNGHDAQSDSPQEGTTFHLMAKSDNLSSELAECRVWNTARTLEEINLTKDIPLELAETRRKRLKFRIN